MNSENKISPRLGAICRNGIVLLSVLTVLFAVLPNFAQDYGQAEHKAQDSNISRAELRDMLSELLSEDQAQESKA